MKVHLKQIVWLVWLALQDVTRPDPVSLVVSKSALQVMRHLRHPSALGFKNIDSDHKTKSLAAYTILAIPVTEISEQDITM